MWFAYLSVAIGSALGGVTRYWLNLRLDKSDATFSMGTLGANLIAAYLIGLFLAFFIGHPKIPQEWKLFLTVGFCGGLSTFSSFSLEVITLLQSQRFGAALLTIAAHLFGSLLLTALGYLTWQLFK